MAKTGGTPTTSFKIWEVPEDADRIERLAHKNPEIERWRSRVNEHQVGGSAEKRVPKMTKFPRRFVSKGTPAPDNPKKTPENMKIPADIPKAPVKPRHAAKKVDGVPKRLEFLEAEDENPESMDSEFGACQPRVDHRYPTRARISAQATQNDNRNQTKSSNAKPAKPKRYKNPPDVDKENDGSAANRAQPLQGSSSNKKRLSGHPVSRLGLQNLATPEELNCAEVRLSQNSSDDLTEHIRRLQPRRDIGLWIECTRKGCGKWRYAKNYHDPLDVPKIWFCEMNNDARFADCSIPQEATPEVESFIESAYSAGSIVWARVNGFPWWPAMIDDCPELLKYYDIRGSSSVPYKYHVKFFNEMKIAWLPVRNLKPYGKNLGSTFLKKIVFQEKEYAEELDLACNLAEQALRLSPLERLERFSWAAQVSGGVRENDEALASKEGPAKKKKSTNKSTIDPRILTRAADNAVVPSPVSTSTRKQAVKKNVTKNLTKNVEENVSRNQTIDMRSRIINVETDSAINTELSRSRHSLTPNGRRPASGTKSLPSPFCWDEASFPQPNQLFEVNWSNRSEVDNSNIEAGPVPSPPSKSKSRPDLTNPACSCEKRKRTEPAHSQNYPNGKSLAEIASSDIGDQSFLDSQLLSMSTQELIIFIYSSNQDPSLAKELREPGTASEATNPRAATQIATTNRPSLEFNSREFSPRVRSDTNVFAGREDPSRWEPIEIDLTQSSMEF